MKILFFTDIHTFPHKKNNYFVHLSYQILEYILNYCIKNDIEKVVFGGDMFEKREIVYTEHLTKTKKILKKFINNGIELIMVVGNHDMPYLNKVDNNVLEVFEEYGVFSTGEDIFYYGTVEGFDLYIQNYTEHFQKDIFPTKKGNNKKILFSHLDIIDFDLNSKKKSEIGFKDEKFEHFDLVLNGHYHNFQKRNNIIIQGSPYKYKLNELEIESGFGVLELKDRKFKYDFHSLNDKILPKVVYINLDEEFENLEDIDTYHNDIEGNYVMLRTKDVDRLFLNKLSIYLKQNYNVIDVFYDFQNQDVEIDLQENIQNEYKNMDNVNFLEKIDNIIEKNYDLSEEEKEEKMEIFKKHYLKNTV